MLWQQNEEHILHGYILVLDGKVHDMSQRVQHSIVVCMTDSITVVFKLLAESSNSEETGCRGSGSDCYHITNMYDGKVHDTSQRVQHSSRFA